MGKRRKRKGMVRGVRWRGEMWVLSGGLQDGRGGGEERERSVLAEAVEVVALVRFRAKRWGAPWGRFGLWRRDRWLGLGRCVGSMHSHTGMRRTRRGGGFRGR